MTNNNELDSEKTKRLVQSYLQKLIKKEPTLYYEPTAQIAQYLRVMIQEHLNRMDVDEKALLKNLSSRDIEVILSYKR